MFGPKVRKSDADWKLEETEFRRRYQQQFRHPNFEKHQEALEEITTEAWKCYQEGKKSPNTVQAGPQYKNPDYELSLDWIASKAAVDEAQRLHEDPSGPSRVLVICASDRNDMTCPGEISKSFRLSKIAMETLKEEGMEVEFLNLSEMTSQFGQTIYPCKGCVSTSQALCHWPCSCYPNHYLGQVHDWMMDIYPMWVRAHGVMIITPVYWHSAPSALKLMIDRLVCADGGNPDPTSTLGKDALMAKKLELKGWDYPRHLQGRIYSLVVHGDTQGVDQLKNTLSNWLDEIMLIPSSVFGTVGRYIGYYGSYAESHDELDRDHAIMEEVQNSAVALAMNVTAERAKKLDTQVPNLHDPRPK